MYFPYLRGKQYELLALKELSQLIGSQGKVLPIIEPVRAPDGGLDRCIEALSAAHVGFVVVVNPTVGELRGNLVSDEIANYVNARDAAGDWKLGLLIDETTNMSGLLSDYRTRFGTYHQLALIHKGLVTELAKLPAATADLNRQFDVIDEGLGVRRHYRDLISTSKGVTLRDGFPGEERNSDYLAKEEAVFSEEHLYYSEEGWYGFGDYLTIGQKYSDGGFTPRAVVIHWTYEPRPGTPIMIRHFTSESNGGTSNVGGKFLEAAQKLVVFLNQRDSILRLPRCFAPT